MGAKLSKSQVYIYVTYIIYASIRIYYELDILDIQISTIRCQAVDCREPQLYKYINTINTLIL